MKEPSFSVKKYARQLLGFILMVTGLHVYAGNLTASVDRDNLGLEETFTLTLRYDEQINTSPDYELLQKDFDILNTQSGTQMSIINGTMEAATEWKIALAPKRIGKLLVPSFTIDGAISDAIEITVAGKSRQAKDGDQQVRVEMETDKDSAYVQEQIIVTLRLYTTVGLNGINLQPLQIKDALVVQLDEQQYKTQINNRPGAVVETRYAVFPQQSGELLIPSMLYQVSVESNSRDAWDRLYGNNQNNLLRLRTEEQRININPAPTAANGHAWLPATKVDLIEHWSAGIDSLKVGEPITRTITIKADGLTAGQIAPLQLPTVDGLTFYSDQAQNDDQKTTKGVVGSRIETIAIVPTKEGRFTLPETRVHWWDNAKQQLQTATLPAVTLKVGSGTMAPENLAANNLATNNLVTNNSEETVALDTELPAPAATSTVIQQQTPIWLYISNIISSLLALFFAARYLSVKRALTYSQNHKRQQQEQKSSSEHAAWNQLKRALADNNLLALRKTIIAWSQIYWGENAITSLQAAAAKTGNPQLAELLQQLDAAVFGGNQSGSHSGINSELLLQLLANLRRGKQKNTADSDTLQPLYKH